MTSDRESLAVAGAVYLGAAILIGLPATVLAFGSFLRLLDALGFAGTLATPTVALPLFALSVVLGLQLATEAAAVQLGGVEALGRGSPRAALVRYAIVTLVAVVVLAVAIWFGFSNVLAGYHPVASVLGIVVAVAGLFALYRSSRAFLDGVRADAT